MAIVTGIVLAAGASERMGELKLLLAYRGTTILGATIAAVAASAVDRVIVVTGARAEEIEGSLGTLISSSPPGGGDAEDDGGGRGSRQSPVAGRQPERTSPFPEGMEEEGESRDSTASVKVVRNPDYRRGNMSSLLTATAGDPDAEAFVVIPGDLPTIRSDVIDSMLDLWFREKPWATVTEYRDRIAHPFLLSRTAVESMEEMTGEKVLWRALIDPGDARVVRLSVAGDAPRDVNTPADYEALDRRPG